MNRNKEKGSRFERKIARKTGGKRSPLSGAVGGGDVWGGLFSSLGLVVECKSRKRMSWTVIREAIEQADADCKKRTGAGYHPIAVFKEDGGPDYCVMRLDDFTSLIGTLGPERAFHIKDLFRSIRRLLDEAEAQLG